MSDDGNSGCERFEDHARLRLVTKGRLAQEHVDRL
jgi:hypothetical protein